MPSPARDCRRLLRSASMCFRAKASRRGNGKEQRRERISESSVWPRQGLAGEIRRMKMLDMASM